MERSTAIHEGIDRLSRILKDVLILFVLYLAAMIVFGFIASMLALGFFMIKIVLVIIAIALIVHVYSRLTRSATKS
ncbi:hypothetical protein [Acidiphilium acidophilum]|uniref:hypothetical protein n=1 Tax=Acidiphilium acidophilum TaxID=76588 RepID=UPI002E8E7908|nr:hypothetical protein [Acidiphilium acidophilum]MEE3503692.1 hypothetical protein [Acidiphilium acidophilum]